MKTYLFPLLAIVFFVGCQAEQLPEAQDQASLPGSQELPPISVEVDDAQPLEEGNATVTIDNPRDTADIIDYEHMVSMPGVWNDDLYLTQAGEESVFVESAGVPTIVELPNGDLLAAFQWFPRDEWFDYIALSRSTDSGVTWSAPEPMELYEYPQEYSNPFDPTLAVTPEGEVRMYFTAVQGMRGPDADSYIYSALSADGTAFTFEEGVRFRDEDHSRTRDAAVVYFKDEWHLYTPDHEQIGKVNHAVSADGLDFITQDDIEMSNFNWLGNVTANESTIQFYGDMRGEVQVLESTNGYDWNVGSLVSKGVNRLVGSDPAVFTVNDNLGIIYTKKEMAVGPPVL